MAASDASSTVHTPSDTTSTVHWTVALLLGLAALTASLGIWWIGYGAGFAPFPPFDLADQLIRVAPGEVAVWAIANLQFNARRLALLGGILAFLALGAALGLLLRQRAGALTGTLLGVLLAPLAVSISFANDQASGFGAAIWLTLWFGLTLAAPLALAGHWIERLQIDLHDRVTNQDHWLDAPGSHSRRDVLKRATGGALALGFGGWALGSLLRNTEVGDVATADAEPLEDVRAGLAATPGATPPLPTPVPAIEISSSFVVPDGVRSRITPNDDFYLIDINTRKPAIAETSWTLRVHGLVNQEIVLSYNDLLNLPPVEMDGTAMCISYTYDNDLISTTRWTGVPLRDVLQMAGIADGAFKIVFKGAGDYSDSIPVAKALEATTLLAYGMNGDSLPREHGFPCRVYVPNVYGEKSVKWLEEIQIVDFDYQGYWQERGWSDDAVIYAISIIDTPHRESARSAAGTVPVGGVAFAGSRGIQSVRIQIDGGPWAETTVEPYEPALVWQRWTYDWLAEPGEHTLTVQATDGEGNDQLTETNPPFPDGMTGLHEVQVRVL